MKRRMFLICGKQYSGIDTVVDMLQGALAAPLKDRCKEQICEAKYEKENYYYISNIIVRDLRYLSEVKYFKTFCEKNNYDMRVIKVLASLETRQQRAKKLGQRLTGEDHPSETEIDSIQATYEINNDYDLDQLKNMVKIIAKTEKSRHIPNIKKLELHGA